MQWWLLVVRVVGGVGAGNVVEAQQRVLIQRQGVQQYEQQ